MTDQMRFPNMGENTTSYVLFQSVRGIPFANGLAAAIPGPPTASRRSA